MYLFKNALPLISKSPFKGKKMFRVLFAPATVVRSAIRPLEFGTTIYAVSSVCFASYLSLWLHPALSGCLTFSSFPRSMAQFSSTKGKIHLGFLLQSLHIPAGNYAWQMIRSKLSSSVNLLTNQQQMSLNSAHHELGLLFMNQAVCFRNVAHVTFRPTFCSASKNQMWTYSYSLPRIHFPEITRGSSNVQIFRAGAHNLGVHRWHIINVGFLPKTAAGHY